MEAIQFTEEQRRWSENAFQLGNIAKSLMGNVENVVDGNFLGVNQIQNPDFEYNIPGETSPVLGNELVQNGSFEEKSAELILNGEFLNGTDNWDEDGGSTISVGTHKGRFDVADINILDSSTGSRITQPFNFTNGARYEIQVEVYLVSGKFKVDAADSVAPLDWISTTETGKWQTLTGYIDAISTTTSDIFLRSGEVAQFYLDSISIKQLDPNDRWIGGTGWSIKDGFAECDGSQSSSSNIQQNSVGVGVGKLYQVQFTVLEISAGDVGARIGAGSPDTERNSVGTYTESYFSITNDVFYAVANPNFIGKITNISVKEIEAVDIDLWTTIVPNIESSIVIGYGQAAINYDSNGLQGLCGISQDILQVGSIYKVVIDYKAINGAAEAVAGTTTNPSLQLTSTTRTTTSALLSVSGNSTFSIQRKSDTSDCNIVIYSVQVYKLDYFTTWSTQSNWVFDRGVGLNGVGIGNNNTTQSFAAVAGETYRIEYEISSYTQGSVRVQIGGTNGTANASVGTFVENVIATNTGDIEIQNVQVGGDNFIGVITYLKIQNGEQSDTLDMTDPAPKAIWIQNGGNLKVTTMSGTTQYIQSLPNDTYIDWLRIKRLWVDGTTVSDITAIY